MPGLRFTELGERFVSSLENAGATVIVVSAADVRPLVLSVMMEGETSRLEVYLWAVTPGGKGRGRPRERRIQLTGVERFTLKAGTRTILGGWSEETGVFAFWDVRRHLGFSAGSPSLQISLDTLERAHVIGMATEVRSVREGQEIAIAVQPDYLLWYVRQYQDLYDCGEEVAEAPGLVEEAPEADRAFIDAGQTTDSQARRHKVVGVVQNFRDARFRPLVLRAYGYKCALTGVALRLVDAAHIVPVSDPTSTDEARNGVALNPFMHRAYDCGLLGILPGGRTGINPRMLERLKKDRLDEGLDMLQRALPSVMRMPTMSEFRPPDDYLRRGLQARGWTSSELNAACG